MNALASFIVGGIGIVLLFGVCAGLATAMEGSAWIDPGGFVCLFVSGGGVGLLGWFIYKKGKQSGQSGGPTA